MLGHVRDRILMRGSLYNAHENFCAAFVSPTSWMEPAGSDGTLSNPITGQLRTRGRKEKNKRRRGGKGK
jgi:hypothetical protein